MEWLLRAPIIPARSGMKENEMRGYVGRDTKKITGDKNVGEKIRAEVTRGGFANSIQ